MRRWVLPAATALAVLLAPAPATGEPETVRVDATFVYTCQLPEGAQELGLRVTAELPSEVAVDEPIRPSSVAVNLTLPAPDLPSVASVTAVVGLDTTVIQQDTGTATWSGALSEPVPVTDPLVLDIPVETAPPVVLAAPGEVVLAAADLTVTLTGYRADGEVTEPPSTELTCAPDQDQTTRLAVVPVVEATEPPSGEEPPPPPNAVVVEPEQPAEPSFGARQVEIPADCEPIDPPDTGPPASVRYCAYVTGYAGVTNLDASILQPHGIVNIGPTNFYLPCEGDIRLRCQQANILANLDGEPRLPEASGAFHAFGFVPTEAKLQLTQVGLAFADVKLDTQAPHVRSGAVITGKYVARVFDATVNGVPLDLGPNCRTKEPLEIQVRANVPPYTLTGGGLLTGMTTIPPFDGCGATENLDPLITGLVHGPENRVRLTQGAICPMPANDRYCPPVKPDPQ